jgi:hypothetical protein
MRLLHIGPTVYRRINSAGLTRLGQTRVDGPTSSSIRAVVSHECGAGKLTPKRNAVRN